MNTRDLEYFVRLAESKSFTEVAQHFHVSQPTITYAIKRLEEKFDTILVEKTAANRIDHLTRTGKVLASYASQVLQDFSKMEKAIEHAKLEKVQLGFPPIIMNEFFERMLPQKKKLDFLQSFHLICRGSEDLRKKLISGDLDLSLLGSLKPLEDPRLLVTPLYRRELVLCVSEQHPLAEKEEVRFAELLEEDFILLDEHNVHLSAFNYLNKFHGNRGQIMTQLDNLSLIKKMVAENLGITILAESAISSKDTGLVRIPFRRADKMYFHVGYAYAPEVKLTKGLQLFVNLLEEMKEG